MDVPALIDSLVADGPRLADAAAAAGWDALVPGCPDWTVRDLVVHTGGVHRWAADIVGERRDTFDTAAGDAVGSGPADDGLRDWFTAGHAMLVETLRAAPADLVCPTFLPADSPRHFWARRQAHETAIHRADAEQAAGDRPSFDVGIAQDGIGELLLGFARRRSNAIATPGRLALRASDGPSWLVTFGGEKIEAAAVNEDGDATVDGTSSDLYLWLWNRPSAARVTGDESVAGLWRGVRVRWS